MKLLVLISKPVSFIDSISTPEAIVIDFGIKININLNMASKSGDSYQGAILQDQNISDDKAVNGTTYFGTTWYTNEYYRRQYINSIGTLVA